MDEIIELRKKIDNIDDQMIELIAQRISIAKQIGVIKKQNGVEIIDKEREEEIMKNLVVMANEKGIDPEVLKKIWEILIKASYEVEG